jgi:pyridoxine 4-dehydrogenase
VLDLTATLKLGGDLPVARLGFGAMRLCGPYIWGPPADPSAAMRLLRRCVERGVQLVDTADAYGPFVTEELIRAALHPYNDGVVIATKGGLVQTGPAQWRPDGRPEHLRGACVGSLRRLGVEQIPLYQLHQPDPAIPLVESLGALAELRQRGLVRHIGLCNVTAGQLREALALTTVASVQNRYSVLDRRCDEVLELCASLGIAFLPWAPLDRGLVGNDDALVPLARAHGVTVRQLALAWLLARSPVMLPIPSTASADHLEENLSAAAIELSPDEILLVTGLVQAGERRRAPRSASLNTIAGTAPFAH